jgi:hypothetical protein
MFLCSITNKYMKSLTLISFIPLPHSQNYPNTYTIPILQSCLSLLISKSMFKRVSQCIHPVSIFYFAPFSSFHYSPLPLYLPPTSHFSTTSNIYSYPLPSQVLYFMTLLVLYHSVFLSLLS